MRTIVVTPPAPIVTLEQAKAHLRIRHDDEDDLIERGVAAATAHIDGPDGWLGRAIGLQTLEARFDGDLSPQELFLALPPIIDVVSITYLDADRVEQTVDPADYELIDRTVYRMPLGATPWAAAYAGREAIRVRYRAGFVANPAADPLVPAPPEPIVAAILLMVGDLFAFRETAVIGTISTSVTMSTTVENLLAPYRVFA